MKPPKCKVFPPSARYRDKVVRSIQFDGQTLVIDIQGEGFSFARVHFSNLIGFRVLDERELCEFWNTYSEPNGWLYEVEEGGWFELESTRKLFNWHGHNSDLKEYFLVDDQCISVLTANPPEIRDIGMDPPSKG